MDTITAVQGTVGTIASGFQHLQSQHVRKTYPDPTVFDRNGDGHFDAIDIVCYGPTWRMPSSVAGTEKSADPPQRETDENVSEKQTGLKQYQRSVEADTEHAVEVTA